MQILARLGDCKSGAGGNLLWACKRAVLPRLLLGPWGGRGSVWCPLVLIFAGLQEKLGLQGGLKWWFRAVTRWKPAEAT